ncbi:NAD(P)/FAD-dependent oxidoreductase [Pseudonocardia sp. C8]|uniref:flavin-containing monooxygenase n=1 Tax=Pseudonocardia sp. C8 TaxID=2762759 RepID=UPI001642DD59|nr:NAD(P)/FAD-dependent oxidoreductase [Pseudonocardia sp. C8]MBC3192979.1 NAD(P)/FAD-dependent oxidoreductase [Pseudonocardia sp. C8]
MTATTRTISAQDGELRAALEDANIPTLLLVLAHLTGDRSWLDGPYRPSRTVATNDNDSAGLPEERRREVRERAFDVLTAVRDGALEPGAPPGQDEIVDWLSLSLGETVPPEYGPALAEEGGFVDRSASWPGDEPPARREDLHVVVIGAGEGGVCAAAALKALGIPFTVIERHDRVGGVWLENSYPGAGVDTPSHLYSYSWAQQYGWSRYFAKQPEILEYLRRCARDRGLLEHIRFRTEVTAAVWDDEARNWRVTVRPAAEGDGPADDPHAGEEIRADVVISAVGQLNRPARPDIPGLADFPGPVFHSARWDHEVDLTGKRVAVLGTGASAMQIVPAIAGTPAHTTIFQRSAQWAVPNDNYLRELSPATQLLMDQVPWYAAWYRLRLLWMYQDKLHPTLQIDPDWPHPDRAVNRTNDKHRAFLVKHLMSEIVGHEDELLDKVLPTYPPYGKRILIDNRWFETLRRDDVSLETAGVQEIEGNTLVLADGSRHEADVLVLATGFQSRRMLYPMDVRGRSGRSLREIWGDDDAYAHLGISVPDFPNFFLLYGPNTNLGHGGSVIFHTECQVGYITRLLVRMIESGLDSVEVRADVCTAYNERVDEAHSRMIWTHPGMSTWYRNAAGRVVTNTPWRLIDYWYMTREPDLAEFHVGSRERIGAVS